jgi:hypothetical protein
VNAVGTINRNIGKNPDPATVKFSGKEPYGKPT